MGHLSMATSCVLVALALPRLICGRPATIGDDGSILSTLESRVSKPEDFSELKAISSLIEQEDLKIPVKLRSKRLSDQRRAELEALVTLSKVCPPLLQSIQENGRLDPERIGRRKRFTVDQPPIELAPIKGKHIGDPAYSLIS
ncbi:PREDICTED: uncharacterized protein LOC105456956 [Wasmannia auropunctata]|uniref:uncharacterized protein LOC105456956 n=1 Tax=Wasmannia auropunctata TaxID=64793 RepID=UPI0005EF82FD|nr:PREDICTED: uncharacterized protein LOC105456956 [Wasmannia auropunctata]